MSVDWPGKYWDHAHDYVFAGDSPTPLLEKRSREGWELVSVLESSSRLFKGREVLIMFWKREADPRVTAGRLS